MIKKLNITFWENIVRRKKLQEYRSQVEKYFQNIDYNEYSRDIIDSGESRDIRKLLNNNNETVQTVFRDVGVIPDVVYTPPPAIGGYIQRINLVDNLFNLQNFDIETQALLDFIDQVDGIYQQDFINSVLRTINPFYWLAKILEFIASIPFFFIGSIGLNQKQIEGSFVGKLVKLIIKLLATIGAIVSVWDFFAKLKIVPDSFDLLNWIK